MSWLDPGAPEHHCPLPELKPLSSMEGYLTDNDQQVYDGARWQCPYEPCWQIWEIVEHGLWERRPR